MIINANFGETTLSDAIDIVQRFYPTEEFAVFHGSELIYEKSELLDEDEIEVYSRNVKKSCKEAGPHGQVLLMIEPEGGSAIKAYFLDSPDLKEPCLEQHIGDSSVHSPIENFMINSNKKPETVRNKRRPQSAALLPPTAYCDAISDNEEAIEEVKNKSISKMDVELADADEIDLQEMNGNGHSL